MFPLGLLSSFILFLHVEYRREFRITVFLLREEVVARRHFEKSMSPGYFLHSRKEIKMFLFYVHGKSVCKAEVVKIVKFHWVSGVALLLD